jgi:hypothetical protein
VTSEIVLELAVDICEVETAQADRKVAIAEGARQFLGSATRLWASQSAPSVER